MSLPNVADAFWDWTTPVQFKLLTTVISDFEVSEAPLNDITFDGVLEPLSPRALLVKPENQRRWKWWTLWTTYSIEPGQVVQDPSGSQFRIMSRSDWGNAGHFQYEAVQDPPVPIPEPIAS